ncbi:hypothetical protein NE865_16302 [Phthorimaea operculella]|nr:hypothetical protein NE865_16302 [Phthorimaea operculella]
MDGSKSSSSPDLNKTKYDDANNQRRIYKRSHEEATMDELLTKHNQAITAQLAQLQCDFEAKITKFHEDIKTTLKDDLDVIKSELKQVNENHEKLASDQNVLVKRTDVIESNVSTNTAEVSNLKSQISNLQSDLNSVLQRDRLQNLEISGIPDKSKENLTSYMINIGKFIGVEVTANDIEYITRAQPRTKNPNRPKTIIVKLKSRLLKDTIISATRKSQKILTSDIGITTTGEPAQIFINEHLTPSNKLLYLQARKKKKLAHFEFVWVRDGKIFARKNETSPVIPIRSSTDLEKMS